MPRLDELERVEPASRAEWRAWLEANHASSPGIWLAVGKKGNHRTTLSYDYAVEEALCFGWIDSTVRAYDKDRFWQLATPRRPGSTWAASNKERVKRLVAQGLMTPAGLAVIERAKADGSWTLLDEIDALLMPPDLLEALAATPEAKIAFDDYPASTKKQALYWIATAKRPETRAARIAQTVRTAAAGERLG